MKSISNFFAISVSTVLAFILFLNLTAVIDTKNKSETENSFVQKLIFLGSESPVASKSNQKINLEGFYLSKLFKVSQNLGLTTRKWCKLNNTACKDLLGYAMAKNKWVAALEIANSLCQQTQNCPLVDMVNSIKNREIKKAQQINNFKKHERLTQIIDRLLKNSNLSVDSIICQYAESELGHLCQWGAGHLKLNLSKYQKGKAAANCIKKNSAMDCWVVSRMEIGQVSDKNLTKACTLDSGPACFQMALTYQKQGHQHMAKKYFEKACLLKYQSACLLLGHEYAKVGDVLSKKYYEAKACLISQSCNSHRSPASL